MYAIKTQVSMSMADAEEKMIEALKSEGFGVLTQIDVQQVLKQKIDVDRKPYKILGACNPVLANDVLNLEPDVGLLLPCNVVLQELENGNLEVSIIDPQAMFTVVDNPQIKDKIVLVKEKFERIIASMA